MFDRVVLQRKETMRQKKKHAKFAKTKTEKTY